MGGVGGGGGGGGGWTERSSVKNREKREVVENGKVKIWERMKNGVVGGR